MPVNHPCLQDSSGSPSSSGEVSIADSATQQHQITQRISEHKTDLLTKSSIAAAEEHPDAEQGSPYPGQRASGVCAVGGCHGWLDMGAI
jgi:hypothetical protein